MRDPNPSALTTVRARSLQHPFTVRGGTTDVGEFVVTVCRSVYAHGLPAGARVVFDLGANVGDTGAWFLSRYPDATVISVEPDDDNYAIAARNLAPYGERSVLVRAAVWCEDGHVRLRVNRDWKSGSRVENAEGLAVDVPAISIPSLMRAYGIHEIDVVKCDIEGAEEQVFAVDPDEWLARTHVLCIEIHSAAAQALIDAATRRCGFRSGVLHRDVTVFTREDV